jgi:transcription initiation factor TFIIIB Brf1 subunit/transcription initiation factor TFIIB
MNCGNKTMQKDISTCMEEMYDDENWCSFCKRIVEVRTFEREGYRVCLSCGVILKERIIDTSQEYNLYNNENEGRSSNPIRVGPAYDFSLPDGGLDLKIEGGSKKDNKVIDAFSYKMKKVKNQGPNYSSSFYRGSKLVRRWAEHLYLPPLIVNKAEDLYHTLKLERKTFRGLSVENLAAAFLWIACREHNHVIEFSALETVSGVSVEDIKKTYHLIMKTNDLPQQASVIKPTSYGENFAKQLGLSDETCALVGRLEASIREKGTLDGKNPKTIAGVSAYIICSLSSNASEAKSWKEIAQVAEMVEATLKKSYKALGGDLDKVLPKWEGMKPITTLKGL